MPRVVETLAVGTELLLGQISNTNGQHLARVLAAHGALHYRQCVVGDNQARVESAIREALGRADMVITIGGLGPTEDDLTKDAVASLFGRRLIVDPPAWEAITRRHGGAPRNPSAVRMSQIPEGAQAIPNPHGSAAGVLLQAPYEGSERWVVCLPGPPSECLPMIDDWLAPFLDTWVASAGGARVLLSRSLRIAGLWESTVESMAKQWSHGTNPTVATYAGTGEIELRITAVAPDRQLATEVLAPVEDDLRERLGPWVYGVDEQTLAGTVIAELAERGSTLAVAESCTGGLLAQRLTESAGASRAFLFGAVTYVNHAKETILGVPADVIATHGAVSAEVASAMAEGARRVSGASMAVGVTGIAGPDGGTTDKPVGTVFLALAGANGTWSWRLRLRGSRHVVRWLASQHALIAIRRYLADGVPAMEELTRRGFYV